MIFLFYHEIIKKKFTVIKNIHSFSSNYYLDVIDHYQFCVTYPQMIKSATVNFIILYND